MSMYSPGINRAWCSVNSRCWQGGEAARVVSVFLAALSCVLASPYSGAYRPAQLYLFKEQIPLKIGPNARSFLKTQRFTDEIGAKFWTHRY